MEHKKKRKNIFRGFTSIRSAMLVSFSILIIAALLIFLLIALNYTKTTVLDNSITYTSRLIGQVNYDIDSYIDYMENISSVMTESQDLRNYLFLAEQPKSASADQRMRIIAQFKTIMESRKDISNVAALEVGGNNIVNDGQTVLNENINIEKLDWYQAAINSKDGIALSSSHVQNAISSSYDWVITLSRAVVNQKTGVRDGVFFIDLNYSAISALCNNNKIGNKGYVFILDKNGNIIYHPQQQLMYGGLKTENIKEIMSSKEDYLVVKEGNDSKLYTMSKSEKTGWTVVGTAYTSELLKNNTQTQILYLIVAVVLLIMGVLISRFIADGITKPVKDLRDSMLKVERGEFETANVAITANNEIGSLSKSFNVMTNRIKELMDEIIYEQRQKRKSELKALQSQINPHFLYNTFDSIIWMAEGKKNEEVVLMTSALARLLRQSISNEDEQVTIRQEIDYTKSYLIIQKMRYKDKMEFEIDVNPTIYEVPIIKLVLQPIVENAIYHGLKYKESKGILRIIGYRLGEKAVIEISDDGVGMSEEVLSHIFDKHKVNNKSNGVGVYNVHARLQLYYGESYGISYKSNPEGGTTATITIPISGGEDHEEV